MTSPFENAEMPDSFFDAVVGNVPFGDIRVTDKRYEKNKFLIHDYFFAKSLDKLRPGGIMCLVTSQGTMDKEGTAVRKYIAQRADLLGAIRLPNNTFKGNAGTDVTSDILILQKRDRITDIEPEWVNLDADENGIRMNKYFVDNPDKMLATGNPIFKEKMDLEIQLQTLTMLKTSYLSEKYSLEDKVNKEYPQKIVAYKAEIIGLEKDMERAKEHPKMVGDKFAGIKIGDNFFTEKEDAGNELINHINGVLIYIITTNYVTKETPHILTLLNGLLKNQVIILLKLR